jgi:hypothetical protein
MTVRSWIARLALALPGVSLAVSALAHPGHGAPAGHTHGLFEALVLVAVVAVSIWIVRGRR